MSHSEDKDGVSATTMSRREDLKSLIHDLFVGDPYLEIEKLNEIAKEMDWVRHEVHAYCRKIKRLQARTCRYCRKVFPVRKMLQGM